MDLELSGLSDAHNVTPGEKDFIDITLSFINLLFQINEEVQAYRKLLCIIVPVIFGAICVFGVFGNVLVIIVILTDRQMRSTTNVLILSLASADLLSQVFCVPFTAMNYTLPIWPFGMWCNAGMFLIYVCTYVSMYSLVIMSLDRYLAVVHAIRSMTWRSERNAWLAVTVIWIISFCGNIPVLGQFGVVYFFFNWEIRSQCVQISLYQKIYEAKVLYITFFFFGYAFPIAIIMLLYGLMLKRLLYGVAPGGGNQSSGSMRAKKRVTRMVIIVVIIFALCYLPTQIMMFLQHVIGIGATYSVTNAGLAAHCFSYMNSSLNPFLYAFLSGNFWRSFRRLMCCYARF